MSLKYNEIGKTGMKVARLAFGASSLGGVFHEINEKKAIEAVMALYTELMDVLGLMPREKAEEFPAEVLTLLDERQAARKAKNYARADEIREQLKTLGYAIEDSRQGAKLKKL